MAEWKLLNNAGGYGDSGDSAGGVTFAPGASAEWIIYSVRVKVTTESSGANRYPRLQIRDSGGTVLQEHVPAKVMGVSDTKFFTFGVGVADLANWRASDTTILTTAIPDLMVWRNHDMYVTVRGQASDDTFFVNVQCMQRPTM